MLLKRKGHHNILENMSFQVALLAHTRKEHLDFFLPIAWHTRCSKHSDVWGWMRTGRMRIDFTIITPHLLVSHWLLITVFYYVSCIPPFSFTTVLRGALKPLSWAALLLKHYHFLTYLNLSHLNFLVSWYNVKAQPLGSRLTSLTATFSCILLSLTLCNHWHSV